MLRCVDKGTILHLLSHPADSGDSHYAQVGSRYREMVITAFGLLADRALAA